MGELSHGAHVDIFQRNYHCSFLAVCSFQIRTTAFVFLYKLDTPSVVKHCLHWITQNFICISDLIEKSSCSFVLVWILVWMILYRQVSVNFLQGLHVYTAIIDSIVN